MRLKYKYSQILYLAAFLIIALMFYLHAIYTYKIINEENSKNIDAEYTKEVDNFVNLLQVFENYTYNKLIASERTAYNYLTLESKLKIIARDSLNIKALIPENGNESYFKLAKFTFNDSLLTGNVNLVEKIRYITGASVSIWQKTTDGYIRIVSNETTEESNPGKIIFLHNSNPIIQAIEKEQKFYEEKSLVFDTKISVYRPLIVNEQIAGMLQVSENKLIKSSLNKLYSNTAGKFKDNFFYIDSDGNVLLNPGLTDNFNSSNTYREIRMNKGRKLSIANVGPEGEEKINIYYKKVSESGGFAGVIAKEDNSNTSSISGKLIFFTAVFSIIIIIMIFVLLKQIFVFEEKISRKILSINETKDLKPDFDIEFLTIKSKVSDKILSVYKEREEVINCIDKVSENKPLSPDELKLKGKIKKTVLKLSKNVSKINTEYIKQKDENELRQKFNAGAEEISVILQHATDIMSLSFSILRKILSFLEVEMGGVFIIDKSKTEIQIVQSAAYAFDKKKAVGKKYSLKDGLLGRCYLEKQSIFLTEIPDDYTKIESGFGETNPKSIVLVPFIFNNEVQGIIELASISIIEKEKIEFLERIGENIASTFSNIYTSKKTEELLLQTREQAGFIEEQRIELEEKIATHRRQNRKLDKKLIELTEIIISIKEAAYVVEYDLTGKILDTNKRINKLLGIQTEDLLNKKHQDIVVDENYQKSYDDFWKSLKKGESKEITEKIVIFENEHFTFLNIYAPIRNSLGRIYRILSIGSLLYEEYSEANK